MTRDELLRKLEEEQTVGWHGVSKPHPLDQNAELAAAVNKKLASILKHPSMGDD